jgi:outer membrane protein assembly factor BamB
MDGVTTCYDKNTGKAFWKERIGQDEYTASPIAASGLVYFIGKTGSTTVLEPGPTFKIVTKNSLGAKDEIFRASLAPCGGQFFARSQTHLYCIGGGK